MKKVFVLSLFALAALTFSLFNYNFGSTKVGKHQVLQLSNIAAMQASAQETTCDATNSSSCTFTAGGVTGHGTGDMITTW